MSRHDFRTEHLNDEQKRLANVIINLLTKDLDRQPSGGGCTAFRTIEDHKARKEEYGLTGVMILVHDGGDLAPYCNLDYCQYAKEESLRILLEPLGYYVENCTSWYSAIYKN